MEYVSSIIIALITGVVSCVGAYITVLPQLKKTELELKKNNDNQLTKEDIKSIVKEEVEKAVKTQVEDALKNDPTISEMSGTVKVLKKSAMAQMREDLIKRFTQYEARDFRLSEAEKHRWDEDYNTYRSLDGNSVVVGMDEQLQIHYEMNKVKAD